MLRRIRDTLRQTFLHVRVWFLCHGWGYQLHSSVIVSWSAYLDKTNPSGIVIGGHTLVARGATILSHDYTRSIRTTTHIGKCCLIGVNAIVLPGITIGDHVVIGAGSVVTSDIPSQSLVAGNPARVLRQIQTGLYGKILLHSVERTVNSNESASPIG